jgi:site-specific recombinase XerD
MWEGTSQTLRGGPFSRENLEKFVQHLQSRGYAANTIREKLHILAEMSRWSVRRRVTAFDEGQLEEFLRDPRRRYRTLRGVGTTGLQIIQCLRASGELVPAPPSVERPGRANRIESEYTRYLREERGVAEATVAVYLRLVHPFVVDYLGGEPRGFAKLDAADVIRFVLRRASLVSRCSAKLQVTALRSFLRFAYVQGATQVDLGAAIPTIPNWRLATLPRFISADEVLRLVRSCDRRTRSGRRDHAILLLLARLGLRAGEVAHLTIEDIDWDAGELTVHGKGQRQDRIPLPPDVGRALADYIHRDRPRCAARIVFIRLKAPLCGLGGTAVAHVVRRAIERVGLQTPTHGAHLLRHSLATDLWRRGSSLPEIAELLRHRSPETTMLYAKVDFAALRRVPPPWPA